MKAPLLPTLFTLLLLFVACQNGSESDLTTPLPPQTSEEAITATQQPPPTTPPTSATIAPTSSSEATPELKTSQPEATPSEGAPSLIPSATSLPPEKLATSIQLRLVAEGFEKPTYLTHTFDDRLFVVEQPGRIKIIQNGQILPDPFLDISDRVGSAGLEQGLLSVAFDPQYQENGRFYVNYTDRSGQTIVSSYDLSPSDLNRADSTSEQIIMEISQPYANHNGGQLQFGPDGYLYIGMGDGGSAGDPLNQGQDPSTLLGALLRVNVGDDDPYAIPEDNPFFALSSIRNEIWATGLRNPWRFSFDRDTGDLYIADVGQNLWEEINFQPSSSPGGDNFGWNPMEGTHCFLQSSCDATGYVLPVAEYRHQDGNCSVTGGYVYRGDLHSDLRGNYFFGDYCSGIIWSLFRGTGGEWQQSEVLKSGLFISSFGADVNGELYVLDLIGGAVYQLGQG